MMQYLKQPVVPTFAIAFFVAFLVIFHMIPREFIFISALLILGTILVADVRTSTLFFIAFIPFFFALPITPQFDNFNMWRIALLFLFGKWLLREPMSREFSFRAFWQNYRAEFLGTLLFVFAFISLLGAEDPIVGLRRIIYIGNAALLLVVVRDLIRKDSAYMSRVARVFLLSGFLVVFVGYAQWISAYLVPAWQWHYWWGQVVSLGMYGQEWANVATNFGNTWFSYSGGGLRLRMFALFPDSHSFPLYVIMVLPALFFLVRKHIGQILSLCLLLLAIILSGTRGIWASIVFPVLLFGGVWMVRKDLRSVVRPAFLLAGVFLFAFIIAWGILFIPQFRESTVSSHALTDRLGSLVDFGETSNAGRIIIWQYTLRSIGEYPLWGVGIGNFPVVLNQHISASRAGASAHNIYLHIASEMGLAALAVFLWFLWEIMLRAWRMRTPFALLSMFSLVWIAGYLLTDAALFDGRALLGFMVFLGLILGVEHKKADREKTGQQR